jgi:hypothetical protein
MHNTTEDKIYISHMQVLILLVRAYAVHMQSMSDHVNHLCPETGHSHGPDVASRPQTVIANSISYSCRYRYTLVYLIYRVDIHIIRLRWKKNAIEMDIFTRLDWCLHLPTSMKQRP